MTNNEYADALRRLADILQANPKMAQPGGCNTLCFSCFDADVFAATVKAFGSGIKSEGVDTIDFVPADFPLPVKVFGHKRWICNLRPTKRLVPRKVIPAKPATAEIVIEAHEEDVIEYICGPILAGAGEPEMATAADIAEALL